MEAPRSPSRVSSAPPSPTTPTSPPHPVLSPSLPTPPFPIPISHSMPYPQLRPQSPPPQPQPPPPPPLPLSHALPRHEPRHPQPIPRRTASSTLQTKTNLPPSHSPRTTASNRRRLGGLFADLGLGLGGGSPLRARAAPGIASSTPARARPAAPGAAVSASWKSAGNWRGRFVSATAGVASAENRGDTPECTSAGTSCAASASTGTFLERLAGINLGTSAPASSGGSSECGGRGVGGVREKEEGSHEAPGLIQGKGKRPAREGMAEWDEGCFVDASSEKSLALHLGDGKLSFLDLPDELLLLILLNLPPTISQLHALALTSKHMYNLSRAPVLWARSFEATPGYALTGDARARGIGVVDPPRGHWEGVDWAVSEEGDAEGGRAESEGEEDEREELFPLPADAVPIHYPTLYRSRHALPSIVRSLSPSHRPHCETLTAHTDSAYCLQFSGQWLITGSRDRTIRIWRLPAAAAAAAADPGAPAAQGKAETANGQVVLEKTIHDAHSGSILGLQFELDPRGHGLLATASSDSTCTLWALTLPPAPSRAPPEIRRLTSLPHASAVLDACLTPTRVVTGTKDCALQFYSREGWGAERERAEEEDADRGLELVHSVRVHRGPVNCVYGPRGEGGKEVVSASGDGTWVVWDVESGREVRRGAGDGRGLACVAWEGDYIVTGDNECLVKLYDANTCQLIRAFEGHTNLVRTVAIDPHAGVVVSGSYDKSVRLWDLHTGHLIKSPHEFQDSLVFDVQFSTNRLISASHDNTVHVLTWGGNLPYANLFM